MFNGLWNAVAGISGATASVDPGPTAVDDGDWHIVHDVDESSEKLIQQLLR